jgi:hypothetical protein
VDFGNREDTAMINVGAFGLGKQPSKPQPHPNDTGTNRSPLGQAGSFFKKKEEEKAASSQTQLPSQTAPAEPEQPQSPRPGTPDPATPSGGIPNQFGAPPSQLKLPSGYSPNPPSQLRPPSQLGDRLPSGGYAKGDLDAIKTPGLQPKAKPQVEPQSEPAGQPEEGGGENYDYGTSYESNAESDVQSYSASDLDQIPGPGNKGGATSFNPQDLDSIKAPAPLAFDPAALDAIKAPAASQADTAGRLASPASVQPTAAPPPAASAPSAKSLFNPAELDAIKPPSGAKPAEPGAQDLAAQSETGRVSRNRVKVDGPSSESGSNQQLIVSGILAIILISVCGYVAFIALTSQSEIAVNPGLDSYVGKTFVTPDHRQSLNFLTNGKVNYSQHAKGSDSERRKR